MPKKRTEEKTKNVFLIWSKKFNSLIPNIDAVAKYLNKKYTFKTIYGRKNEIVYFYENGIFKPTGVELIKTETEKCFETYTRNNAVNEVLGKIKRLTRVEPQEFEKTDLDKIPFLNGVLNLKTNKLEKHSPENNFRFIIPINYLPKKDCPKFKKFLKEILPESIHPLIQEWFGFQLYRKYFIKKAFIGKGEQNTSKTTLLNILINFVGEQNKTGVPLQKIAGGNDFTKLSLKDKHANTYDDLSFKDINDEGAFKIATGGGYISAEEKFGDYLQFLSFAKHTFMTNQIPSAKNKDDVAYFGRWIIVEFENVIAEEDKNPFLVDEIKEENPGILNWALQGLHRLLENKKFSYDKTPQEIKKIMESSGNPLVLFAEECLEQDKGSEVTRDNMTQLYSVWASERDKQGKTKRQLGSEIPTSINWIIDKRDNERIWGNVKIKQEWIGKIKPKEQEKKENQNKSQRELDTLDTSTNTIRTISKTHYDRHYIYVPKNASNVSEETEEQMSKEQEKGIKDLLNDTELNKGLEDFK